MSVPKQINVVRDGKWTPIPWEEFALSSVDWEEWPGGAAEIESSQRYFKARAEELEKHAAALAEALDGYQECCGEDHPRPNYECETCGKEERVLSAYREFIQPKG